VLVEQQVGGLDVAVDEPAGMRVRQRGRDVAAGVRGLRRRQPDALVEHAAEAAAREQLEDHERDRVVAPVVHGRDVRMMQRSGELGLGAEAAEEAGVVRQRAVQHLHRDAPPQTHVVGDVHASTPARADRGKQPVPVGEHAAGEIGEAAQRHERLRYRTRASIPRHTARLASLRGKRH
jgi:hypothetical protein